MRYLLSLALLAFLAMPAYAAFEGPGNDGGTAGAYGGGGFQGPTGAVNNTTVKQVLKAWDESPVVLTGHIVERKAGSDDKYLFRDSTGTIIVDIDYEVFAGRVVTPQTLVRLSGEVDKDVLEPTKIDVKFLEIAK